MEPIELTLRRGADADERPEFFIAFGVEPGRMAGFVERLRALCDEFAEPTNVRFAKATGTNGATVARDFAGVGRLNADAMERMRERVMRPPSTR